MNQSIIIIDSFYDVPYQYHEGFLKNQCVITEETYKKISNVIGNEIEIIDAVNDVLSESKDFSVCAHLLSDWIAIVYLSLPAISFGEHGIKFYSHIATGLETFPTEKEKQIHDLKENNLLNVFANNRDLWKEYVNIPAKYNRAVLFRSDLWHSYGNGFGKSLNDSMLYQKIIFKNV